MPSLEAMVFDFDGTLAEIHLDFGKMKNGIAALAEAFLDYRPEPGDLAALEWMERLAAEIGQKDPDQAREFLSRGRLVVTAMELDAAKQSRLFDFTRPTLAALREKGVATGIISRNITAAVKTVFPDVNQYVGVFVAREDAPKLKPDPAHLMQALDVLGVPPERALMVGDHPMDVDTGKAAGALAAGVTSGQICAETFAPSKPDFMAEDVGDLMDQLVRAGLL